MYTDVTRNAFYGVILVYCYILRAICLAPNVCPPPHKFSPIPPNRIFMSLINPPSGNVKIQKLIAKHIFDCFEKRSGEDGKK